MPRWLAIVIVIAVVGSIIAIGIIPIRQRRETTPARRALTWTGLVGVAVVGVGTVALLALYP